MTKYHTSNGASSIQGKAIGSALLVLHHTVAVFFVDTQNKQIRPTILFYVIQG